MTTITTIEKYNFDYIKNLPDTIYVGMQPVQLKETILEVDRQFNAALFMRRNAVYEDLSAIGILDSEKKEHVIAFKNLKSFQACLKFLYTSSMVIPRRWYLAKNA